MPAETPPDDAEAVTLVIPASNDNIRFARLVMSTIASKVGFDYDTIDDLRIAVDELCASVVVLAPPGAQLTVVYRANGDGLRVDGQAPAISTPPAEAVPGELSRQILAAVVDEHGFAHGDGEVTFSMYRRFQNTTA